MSKTSKNDDAWEATAPDLIWRSAPCIPAGFPRIENDGAAYAVIDPPSDTPAPSITDSSTVEDAKAARLARDREDAARFGASFSAIVGLRIPGRPATGKGTP